MVGLEVTVVDSGVADGLSVESSFTAAGLVDEEPTSTVDTVQHTGTQQSQLIRNVNH